MTAHPLRVGETAAVLALGSNEGRRQDEIHAAVTEVADTEGVRLTAVSRLVESAALTLHGVDEIAPRYLNAVVAIATTLDAPTLLRRMQAIEHDHGRVRTERWGDRPLDIDIVVFGDVVSDDPVLTLPHPRAHERAFVLVPWLAIDPDAVLPGTGRIDALVARLDDAVSPWPAEGYGAGA